MNTNKITPYKATHPGILIRDELEVREDLNQKQLSEILGVLPSFLNEIIKGKRPITADMAILLEEALGISAEYWMRFQSQYEIDKAKQKEKNIEKIKWMKLWEIVKANVPISYFRKQGYLTGELKTDIQKINEIYEVCSVDELIEKISEQEYKNSYHRKSEKLKIDEHNMLAWDVLAVYEAKRLKVNAFNFDHLPQLNRELGKIFYKNKHTVERVKQKLQEFGIKFLIIPKISKAPIDGFSFWSENNPAIALTLRHNRIDNFAFTLMHEIGHIDLHIRNNRNKKFMDLIKIENNRLENEANTYAQDQLIPKDLWDELQEHYGHFDDSLMNKIAKKHHIHPGIIFGRYCFETDNYKRLTKIDLKLD